MARIFRATPYAEFALITRINPSLRPTPLYQRHKAHGFHGVDNKLAATSTNALQELLLVADGQNKNAPSSSCDNRAAGISGGAAVTMMASNGARACQPCHPSPCRVETLCKSSCFRRRRACHCKPLIRSTEQTWCTRCAGSRSDNPSRCQSPARANWA